MRLHSCLGPLAGQLEAGQLNVRSAVNLRLLRGLRAAGIDIPFPQRVVHVRQQEPIAISSATEATS